VGRAAEAAAEAHRAGLLAEASALVATAAAAEEEEVVVVAAAALAALAAAVETPVAAAAAAEVELEARFEMSVPGSSKAARLGPHQPAARSESLSAALSLPLSLSPLSSPQVPQFQAEVTCRKLAL